MEEEKKVEQTENIEPKEEKKSSDTLRMVVKILIGIVLVVLGLLAIWFFKKALWTVIKGCIGPFLVLVGLIFFAIARD